MVAQAEADSQARQAAEAAPSDVPEPPTEPPTASDNVDELDTKRARMMRAEEIKILSMLARGCVIMEVFSFERVGRVCKEHCLVPGPALDLQTGWGFSRAADRAKAVKLLNDEQPELVTLSPPCTEFSRLQSLNRHVHGQEYVDKHEGLKVDAVKHVEFSIKLAKMQMRRGRWFIFEHLAYGDTWHEECVQRFLNFPDVEW